MRQFLIAEAAEAALTRLADALDQVDTGIVLLDRDMRVRFLNRHPIEMFDLPPALLAAAPTFRELLDHPRTRLAVQPAPAGEYHAQLEAAVRAGSIPPTHINFADGTRLLLSCDACPDGGRIVTYTDVSRELRPEALDAMAQINAELRFNQETMEDHAAHLAGLAEAADENAHKIEEAKRELEREIGERRQLEEQLRRLATTDGLTGALNRAGFLALAQVELERDWRPGLGPAVMMIDVDHFKSINDRYGHAGGDLALKHLVTLLGDRVRRGDLLGRLGGEEFAIMLPAIAPEQAERLANRLVAGVAKSCVTWGDGVINMTVSIGLTIVVPSDRSIERIIARADDALYLAKGNGRNRVVKDHQAAAA